MRVLYCSPLMLVIAGCGARGELGAGEARNSASGGGTASSGPSGGRPTTTGGAATNGGNAGGVTQNPERPPSWKRIAWDETRAVTAAYLWTGSAWNTWAITLGETEPSGAGYYLEHWDGARWTRTWKGVADDILRVGQIWAAPSGAAFAGSDSNLMGWRRDDWTGWSRSPGCSKVGGTAEDDIWCATDDELFHFDGGSWSSTPRAGTAGIQALARDDVWTWGSEGIWHFDGRSWSLLRSGWTRTLSASAKDDVWAIPGDATELVHCRGAGTPWTVMKNPSGAQLSDVWSQSSSNTWIVGAGAAMRWDGKRWSLVELPDGDEFLLISGSDRDVWIAGVLKLLHGRAVGD